jgi:AraC-like DNA-binding protein
MPRKRQKLLTASEIEDLLDIRGHAFDLTAPYTIHKHSHDWHQLIYASRGVMTVNTTTGSWVVPSRRAVWVPAGMEHEVELSASTAVRTLYLKKGLSDLLPDDCCVINVSPLLRELILRATEIGLSPNPTGAQHLIDWAGSIPRPADVRSNCRCRLIRGRCGLRNWCASPADNRPLDVLVRSIGASKRTVERLFLAETEMTFGRWRQQLRMLHALRLLAAGESVTFAALEVGYDSTSAFISAFKNTVGTTPGRYYANGQDRK